MSSTNHNQVFQDIDAEKQRAIDQWVFDHLPLSAEQKAEFLHGLVTTQEEKECGEGHGTNTNPL
jgi:hypothetical protein